MSSWWNKFLGFFGFGNEQSESEHRHHHRHHESLTHNERLARSQMEFYFSPSNVQRDSFMQTLINEGEDRYCPLSIFNENFNKISSLGLTLEQLAKACSTSRKLELNPEKTHVRSKEPFKSDPRIDFKTISIEGLDTDETQETLKSKLEKQFGKVNYLLLRNIIDKKTKRKKFSGKIDVELTSESKAKDAQETGFIYNDETLPVKIVGNLKQSEETPQKEKSSHKRTPRSAKPKAQE